MTSRMTRVPMRNRDTRAHVRTSSESPERQSKSVSRDIEYVNQLGDIVVRCVRDSPIGSGVIRNFSVLEAGQIMFTIDIGDDNDECIPTIDSRQLNRLAIDIGLRTRAWVLAKKSTKANDALFVTVIPFTIAVNRAKNTCLKCCSTVTRTVVVFAALVICGSLWRDVNRIVSG